MSIRNFIGASSALLLAWLGATYMHQVPAERYPTDARPTAELTAEAPSNIVASVDTLSE